jgi:hypothetical protein
MKQKVRILLAYFRGLGVDRANTYINIIYNSIEDWNYIFEDNKGNEFKPPKSIIDIIEDLMSYKMKEFHKYNEYEYNDYWTLFINIYPKKNIINFQSECEIQIESAYPYNFDLTSSKESSKNNDKKTLPQEILDKIDKTFDSEMPEETEIVSFSFDGIHNEIYVNDIYVDKVESWTRKEPWSKLLDDVMRFVIDRWWSDGPGVHGTIKFIKDKNLIIDCTFRSLDYEMTDMNINVTPDNFEE